MSGLFLPVLSLSHAKVDRSVFSRSFAVLAFGQSGHVIRKNVVYRLWHANLMGCT